MEVWHDFFVASAGAAAALMGLLFVGLSINLSKILSFPVLADRALVASILLLSILIQSLFLLVPYETPHVAGICILIATLITWPSVTYMDMKILRKLEKEFQKLHISKMIFDQIALLPYLIGAIILISGSASGFYWLVASVIISFLKASLDAWVLLVEINR